MEVDQLIVHFQPQAELETGIVTGAEALVRWNHPRRGLIPPLDFVPLAENTGLIGPLTFLVLDAALRQLRLWDQAGMRLDIAVNLSTRSLLDRGLAGSVQKLLQRYEIDARRLELEITESMIAADPLRALEVLRELCGIGVRLALDDFGTGYSSLANLRDLPVGRLKIDRSFTSEMSHSPDDEAIVNSTIALAHALGLEVVAEGVETEHHWQRLREMSCDLAQGYWLARPMDAVQFAAWFKGREKRSVTDLVPMIPVQRRAG